MSNRRNVTSAPEPLVGPALPGGEQVAGHKKTFKLSLEGFWNYRVNDGTRTHDPQNHNLMF